MSELVALLCSDLHLSHKAPVARSAEPDWYAAMERVLKQLDSLQMTDNGLVPILFAGDLFDRWHSPPELINFALEYLPEMFAVPGQHDLPNHSYEERKRSAYWTLVEAGRIVELDSSDWKLPRDMNIRGFPWGSEIRPYDGEAGELKIAVVHRFVYQKGRGYPGAPKEQEVSRYRKALQGYDVAVFGDNHVGFQARAGDCLVWNCGSMMRRAIDQRDYEPMVGMLYSDGTVKPHFLDCSEDKWIDGDLDEPLTRRDFTRFMEELSDLGGGDLDFRQAIDLCLEREKVAGPTKRIVLEAVEVD